MIKSARLTRLTILVAAIGVAAITGGSAPPTGSLVSVSIPVLHIAAGERVVGFNFRVASGRVVQVPDIPIGWDISVRNDPSWNTEIDGTILVASAAVDASFFRGFLVVQKDISLGIPFEIKGEVVVSEDFLKTKKIPVRMSDLTLTRVARR